MKTTLQQFLVLASLALAPALPAWEGRADLGAGPSQLFSQSFSAYYDPAKSLPGFQNSNVDSLAVHLALEADFEHAMLLQFGFDFGPTFDMKMVSPAGFNYSETFTLSNTYVMPGLAWKLGSSGLSLGLGIPLGYAFVSGTGTYSDAGGTSISQIGGWALSYGATLRLEYAVMDWVSLGSDFSYVKSGLISVDSRLVQGGTPYSLANNGIDFSGSRSRVYISLHPNLTGRGGGGHREGGPLSGE